MRSLHPLASIAALAALALVGAPGPAWAGTQRIHDSDELNYELRVPDTWNWVETLPVLKEMGVVESAERKLVTLADGKTPAEGQGGLVRLSVQPVPATLDPDYETMVRDWQTLQVEVEKADPVPEELAKKESEARTKLEKTLTAWVIGDTDAKRLLLSRWGADPARWPKVEFDGKSIDIARLPAVQLLVSAPCTNLGGIAAPCDARMFVVVIRKRLYRLALWRWPTPKDRDPLRDDLDEIELSFDISKKEAIAKRPDAKKPDGPGDRGDKPEGKREMISDLALGFKVAKPAKLSSRAIDRATEPLMAFDFKAQSGMSDLIVDMQVYWIGKAGRTGFNLTSYLTGLYMSFVKDHAEGPLFVVPFPPASERNPFLSLPDITKKKEIKRPPEEDKDKVPSVQDLERLGVVAESKGVRLSGDKLHETWRWCMGGNRARRGEDYQFQLCFSNSERTYVLRVTARGEGWALWKDDIEDVVKSLTLVDVPK